MSDPINVQISANEQIINYGDTLPSLTNAYTIIFSDGDNNHLTDIVIGSNPVTLQYASKYNTGRYNITINESAFTINSNSTNTYNLDFTNSQSQLIVNKVELNVNKTTGSSSYVYGSTINYTQLYEYSGFIIGESISNVTISGNPTIYVNGSNSLSSYSVGSYTDITIHDIGTLLSQNYSFIVNTSSNTNVFTLTITKAPLIISPKQPTSSYIYGNNTISYTDLYNVTGFVNGETLSILSLDNNTVHPTILFISSSSVSTTYTYSTSQFNAGTYTIRISDIGGITSTNYSFTISNPSTLPNIVITKKPITISITNSTYKPYYGDSTIQTSLLNNVLTISGIEYSQSISSISTGTINFKLTSNSTAITRYTLPGTYTVIVDISSYISGLTNYFCSSTLNIFSLTILPAVLTVTLLNYTCNYGSFNSSNLFSVSGYVNGDSLYVNQNYHPKLSLISSSITITYDNFSTSQSINVGTYTVGLIDSGNLNSNNAIQRGGSSSSTASSYVFSISSATTTLTINKVLITINITNTGYQPFYGDSAIQTTLFNNTLTFSGIKYYQSVSSISRGSINFNLTNDGSLISSTTTPGTYNVTIDKSNFENLSNNYTFTFSPTNTYNLTIQKAQLTVKPVSSSTYQKNYGDTFSNTELNSLFQVTGFIGSDGTQATVCTGIPTIKVTDNITNGNTYLCNSSIVIPYSSNNYLLSILDVGSLVVNSSSNYSSSLAIDNTIRRPVQINKITLASKSLVFSWNKKFSPIPYGVPLTSFQLNAITPLNPYTQIEIGTVSYVGSNESVVGSVPFTIGGTPNVGTYILTATMTVTDTNFIAPSPQQSVINNNPMTILPNYPLISHFNPLPIPSGSALTSTQLSATCNSTSNPSTDITYIDDNGNPLVVGTVINSNTVVTEILNNYSNSNYYPKYTFRKIKLDIL